MRLRNAARAASATHSAESQGGTHRRETTRDGPMQVQSIRPCATWHLQAMPLHVSHSDTREGCYYMFHVLTPLEGVTTHLRPNER